MSFVSLNTALTGIRAAQLGMDTAAHNVSNAHTPGYTRQRVLLSPRDPYATPYGKVGSGVTVVDIARTRDAFLDARMRAGLAQHGFLETRAGLLERTEAVLAEPEDGVSAELGNLWASFEELALNPSDSSTRRQALAALESLAARIRGVAEGWTQLRIDATDRLRTTVGRVNDLTKQVADLNRDILEASAGIGTPHDLLDRRDTLIDELAGLLGTTVTDAGDGTVRVSLNGLALVSGTRKSPLTLDAFFQLGHPSGAPVTPGGEAGALQRFLTTDLPGLAAELDAFAGDLAAALNAQHAAGYTPSGAAGGDLLTFTGSARTLTVAITDPQALAAAGDPDAAPNDGRNAEALAGLRTTSGLDEQLRALVTDFAAQVASARRVADAQGQLNVAAKAARRGVHGVSVDEEMVSMLAHQRMLEASSRVLTAVDEALGVLINRTGIVGR